MVAWSVATASWCVIPGSLASPTALPCRPLYGLANEVGELLFVSRLASSLLGSEDLQTSYLAFTEESQDPRESILAFLESRVLFMFIYLGCELQIVLSALLFNFS